MGPETRVIEIAVIKAPPGVEQNAGLPVVAGSEFTIGRSPECDMCLPHVTVSRRHARILPEDDAVMVEQLSPRGATYVHNRRIGEGERVTLKMPEDFVQVGALILAVREQSNTVTYSLPLDVPAATSGAYLMVACLGDSTSIVEIEGAPIRMARAPTKALIALAETPGTIVAAHRVLHSVDPMYERYGGGNVNQLVTYIRNAFVDACEQDHIDLPVLRGHVASALGEDRASRWNGDADAREVARVLVENVRGRGYVLNLPPELVTVHRR